MKKKISQNIELICIAFLGLILTGCEGVPSILNPKGVVAFEERQLLFDTTALMMVVVLAVIIMSFVFIYHYRATNLEAEYKPEWCHNTFLELVWWGVPCAIILIIGTMTWQYTHKLDPYRKLNYPGEMVNIQVVALPWKWLFIYTDYNIATVNYLALPNNKQAEFHLTSDNVPMSAFFIPQLGSQIYTMAGMTTQLHLVPTYTGLIKGVNSQYNGDGFSEMQFDVNVLEQDGFDKWIEMAKKSSKTLSKEEYSKIRHESIAHPSVIYSGSEAGLFNSIIKSYNSSSHPSWSDGGVNNAN